MILERRIESRFSNTYCLDPIHSSRAHFGTCRSAGTVYLSKLNGERAASPGVQSAGNSSRSSRPGDQNRKTHGFAPCESLQERPEITRKAYILNIYSRFSRISYRRSFYRVAYPLACLILKSYNNALRFALITLSYI